MLNILICDDDANTAERIRSVVEQALTEANEFAKLCIFSDVKKITDAELSGCDIALLDIDFENSSSNGMDLARRLRRLRNDAVIVFVTNYIEYAPEGYEVQALRYVLKRDLQVDLKRVVLLAVQNSKKEMLSIQVNGENVNIPLDRLLYLEVQQHYVTAVTEEQRYSFLSTLTELEERLAAHGFLRIHKSFLVNMKYLKKFQCREAVLENGMVIRVSEKSYAENKAKYLLWKGRHRWNT